MVTVRLRVSESGLELGLGLGAKQGRRTRDHCNTNPHRSDSTTWGQVQEGRGSAEESDIA